MALNNLIEPVRKHFSENAHAKALLEEIKGKTTLETGGELVKTTLETGGELVKTTLETSVRKTLFRIFRLQQEIEQTTGCKNWKS